MSIFHEIGGGTPEMADEFRKNPGDVLDYTFDWSAWLAPTADTIATSAMSVSPTGLTITSPAASYTSTNATVWASGGTVPQSYTVTNTITTAAGRTRARSIIIRVQYQ